MFEPTPGEGEPSKYKEPRSIFEIEMVSGNPLFGRTSWKQQVNLKAQDISLPANPLFALNADRPVPPARIFPSSLAAPGIRREETFRFRGKIRNSALVALSGKETSETPPTSASNFLAPAAIVPASKSDSYLERLEQDKPVMRRSLGSDTQPPAYLSLSSLPVPRSSRGSSIKPLEVQMVAPGPPEASGACSTEEATWSRYETDDGYPYYVNNVSGESVWELPAGASFSGEFPEPNTPDSGRSHSQALLRPGGWDSDQR